MQLEALVFSRDLIGFNEDGKPIFEVKIKTPWYHIIEIDDSLIDDADESWLYIEFNETKDEVTFTVSNGQAKYRKVSHDPLRHSGIWEGMD